MNANLINYLVCPTTKSKLKLKNETIDNSGQIKSGVLVAENQTQYPIINYIPRFIPHDAYTDTFSIQRRFIEKKFHKWQVETNRQQIFEASTNIKIDQIDKQSLFLDAGCGYGRFCELISNNPDQNVIGVDMSSTSIELAQKYVGNRKNVHLIQCDLTQLPFEHALFDYIFSIGVLHHTPDPFYSFEQLVPFLKSSGQISIWVYPPEMKKIDNLIRLLTLKMPKRLVFYLSMFMPWIYVISKKLRKRPMPENFSYWPCTMSFFDSWTPKYASVHTAVDVVEWFENCGLKNISVLNRRTSVTGKNE
jgi:ubiquinone/menaquinone biosynthesis C-methylase UbiE/uncharacterized protein YbaR (Trm112 family)